MTKYLKSFLIWSFVVIIIVTSLFPFYYAFVTSFKTGQEIFQPSLWIESFNWQNYRNIFVKQDFFKIILNSVVVSTVTVVLSLAVSVTAAYALGRIRFRGKSILMYSFLSVSMFPQIAVLSGLYALLQFLGLYNNLIGLSLSYMIFTLPFTIWVLTSFVKNIPRDLEEAAKMDGANPLQIIYHVFLPILAPAFVTTGLLAFIAAWNEFLFALTFTINEKARTIPVAINLITGASHYELPFGPIMAASVVVTVPLIILVLVFQRQIVAGLTEGAVKG